MDDMAQDPQEPATMQPAYDIPESVTVKSYLDKLSDTRPAELVFGSIRQLRPLELPDKCAADRICEVLSEHLSAANVGSTFLPPVDVILDETKNVVVHPNIAVVLPDRLPIVREQDQIWGAPHVVFEVLHTGRAKRARLIKTRWYRHYGVQECWLIDPHERSVEIYHTPTWEMPQLICEGTATSHVLPGFSVPLDRLFASPSPFGTQEG
jgi:Uma2 family endonuclease